MRRKDTVKTASPKGATENANRHSNVKARENTPSKVTKLTRRPYKTLTGLGLGKAGVKRLGRLLKRAIQDEVESTGRGKASLPKTPFRLFKYQIQTKIDNAPKTNSAKPTPVDVRHLILNVVSQCRHRGGISMAELKQALAAGGYDVTKNNRRVNAVTQRLVNNDTLIRTTRSVTFRLNNKKNQKQPETKQVRTSTVKSPKPKGDPEQRKNTSRSPKGAEKSQRPARKSTQPKGKISQTTKSHKQTGETLKPAATSHKSDGKTRKPAAKSCKPRKKTPKAKGKSPKPAGNKRRSATNQAAQVRKAPRKAQRAWRRRPKQTQHPYKSSQKTQPPRQSWRQVARRRAYYY
ncbi:histone H1-like [Epinephelus fuscoguttatus]|uniref:histone H1-like n=1 Tax=Epinephelus fuscoguttatus TaxID=293821 RepID=UPI0020D032AA|nr:histone H1-like [Epinephelus fuscoguttatus]